MTKHTPKKLAWIIRSDMSVDNVKTFSILNSRYCKVAETNREEFALLIASAPELLEAGKYFLKTNNYGKVKEKIEQAIAKAEGGLK